MSGKWRRFWFRSVMVLGVAFVAIQFVPVERSNPAVESDIVAPPEVAAVLKRACYDCHSHETVWPWYSRIAPVSWLVARDVREGRRELNFSRWGVPTSKRRGEDKTHEIWEEVEDGEMPPWFYVMAHSDAKLTDGDRAVLRTWALGTAAAGREREHEEDD